MLPNVYLNVSLPTHTDLTRNIVPTSPLKEDSQSAMKVLLVLALLTCTSVHQGTADDAAIVGKTFFLPHINLLQTITGGQNIFNSSMIQRCVIRTDIQDDHNDLEWYKDNDVLYRAVADEAGLSGSYGGSFTLKTSLDGVYSTESWKDTEVKSSSLDYGSYKEVVEVNKVCAFNLSMLTANFYNDLVMLPTAINDPSIADSWEQYELFVNKYGSHVLTKVHLGARLQHFATTEATTTYNETAFLARLCLDVEGPTPGEKFTVTGCSAFSKDDREGTEEYDMNLASFIRGGDPNLRAKLQVSLDPTTIEQFIASAQTNTNPIQYGFTPIWELVNQLDVPKSDMYYRALNMMAYYSGFKEYGCPKRLTSGGYTLQQLVELREDRGHFQCQFAMEGCRYDSDCHIGDVTVCYCYGDTCIKNDQYGRPQSQTSKTGSYDEGVNNSCHYKAGVHCGCRPWGNTTVAWDSHHVAIKSYREHNVL